jgi:hypothetical protein
MYEASFFILLYGSPRAGKKRMSHDRVSVYEKSELEECLCQQKK